MVDLLVVVLVLVVLRPAFEDEEEVEDDYENQSSGDHSAKRGAAFEDEEEDEDEDEGKSSGDFRNLAIATDVDFPSPANTPRRSGQTDRLQRLARFCR